jgi:hypothetical protein
MQLQRYNPLFTSDRLDPATRLLRKKRESTGGKSEEDHTISPKSEDENWPKIRGSKRIKRRKERRILLSNGRSISGEIADSTRKDILWRCVGHLIFMLLDAPFQGGHLDC